MSESYVEVKQDGPLAVEQTTEVNQPFAELDALLAAQDLKPA